MGSRLKKKTDLVVPQQARAIRSYESMLYAAQQILEEKGLEALNSNAIVSRAGVTTPVFYRYFSDKYYLLQVLGERLTGLQDKIFLDSMEDFANTDPSFQRVEFYTHRALLATYEGMKAFVGGLAILTSLRAVPELSKVRKQSNHLAAKRTSQALTTLLPDLSEDQLYERARVGIEIGYTAIELLLDETDLDPETVLKSISHSIIELYKY